MLDLFKILELISEDEMIWHVIQTIHVIINFLYKWCFASVTTEADFWTP